MMTEVEEAISSIPFLNSKENLGGLKSELPAYLLQVADTNPNFPPLEWWELNANALSKWSASFSFFFLLQLSSAAAERVFFLIESFIGEQQNLSLQDYIETSRLEVGDFQVM